MTTATNDRWQDVLSGASRWAVVHSEAMDLARQIPDRSLSCIITSPPYWGLRDYGTATWEGGDPDCVHQVGGQVQDSKALGAITTGQRPGVDASTCRRCGAVRHDVQIGLERTPEEYVARLAALFAELRRALRDDGTLWLNVGDSYASTPPGCKGVSLSSGLHGAAGVSEAYRAHLEQSVGTKRNTIAAGLKPKDLVGIPWMLAFALRADGWYLRSDIIWHKPACMPESVRDRPTCAHEHLFLLAKSERYWYDADAIKEPFADERNGCPGVPSPKSGSIPGQSPHTLSSKVWNAGGEATGRNRRNVWSISPEPLDEQHYAAWPTALVTPCILAGCPADGIVYDPFTGGSGRLPGECIRLGRRFIGSEASAKYATMTRERVVYGHGKTGGEARIEPKGVLL